MSRYRPNIRKNQLHLFKATTVRKHKFLKDAICNSNKNKDTKTCIYYTYTHTHKLEVAWTKVHLYIVCFWIRDSMDITEVLLLPKAVHRLSAFPPHTKTDGASLMGFPDTWSLSPSRVSDTLAQGPRTRPELLHLKNERVNNTWSLKSPLALTPQVLWDSRAGGDSGRFSEAPPTHTHCPPEGNEVTNPDGSGPKTPPRNPDF